MQKHFEKTIRCFVFLFFLSCGLTLQAQVPRDFVVDLQATVSDSSPRITLSWTLRQASKITGQKIYRRTKGASSWGSALATLSTSATSYADTTAVAGVEYEYWLERTLSLSPSTAIGYISAGVKVPETHARGTLLLVVDDTMTSPLATEIAQLKNDLAADGWYVQQINAPRSGTAISTKALIKTAYDADPTNVRAVFLLGHVPVPYSGYSNPDGHGSRALPCDGYYADMNGTWTDTSTYSTSSGSRGNNVAGDGKFDQSSFPSPLELQVGRVDLSSMLLAPSANVSETSLLRRYLKKDHDFRYKLGAYASIPRRSLIRDTFSYFSGECFAINGWATAFSCVGNPPTTSPIDEAPVNQWFTYATANSYLFGHVNGSGTSTSFLKGANTYEFGRKPSKVVFTSGFGSYSLDWDVENAIMRAILAGNATGDSLGLTCYWTGRPHYFTHHPGMGETIGYAIRATQNSSLSGGGAYTPTPSAGIYLGLMGDPSLRMHMVEPPRGFTASSTTGQVSLSWKASTEAALQGYHVYRASSPEGPYTRLTSSPQAGTTYTDTTATAGQSYTYMVRTLILDVVPGGSYYNLSQGALATITANSGSGAPPRNPTELTVSGTASAQLSWVDNSSDETGFRIERRPVGSGSYATIGSVPANATTFSDPGPFVQGTAYIYRVVATGAGGDSSASNEVSFETAAGTIDFQTSTFQKVSRAAGTALIPVERYGGSTGAVGVHYVTADRSAVSGTHFTGGNGTLTWADGESGVKYISIPLTGGTEPHQARQFRVTLNTPTGGVAIGSFNTLAVLIEDPSASLSTPWQQTIVDSDNGADTSTETVNDYSPAVDAENGIGSTTLGGFGLDTSISYETGHFIYQPWTGDGVLTAYVPSGSPVQADGRFAVMVRENHRRNSRMAATVTTGDATLSSKFIYRPTTSTSSTLLGSTTGLTTPRWIRIIRASDKFTSQVSADGTTWTTLGSVNISLPASCNWGLFHISENLDFYRAPFADYQLAHFQNVSLESLPPATSPTGLGSGTTTSSSVPLTWDVSPYASGYRIERRSEDGSLVQFADITTDNSFSDTSVEPDSSYEYRILAYNRLGESTWSNFVRIATPPADAVTLITAEADAQVEYDNPSSNFGGAGTLPLTASDKYINSNDVMPGVTKAWLRFNLGSLPTIKSSKLKLTLVSSSNTQAAFDAGGDVVMFVRLLAETSDVWDEAAINWNNAPQNSTSGIGMIGTSQLVGTLTLDSPSTVPAENSSVEMELTASSLNTYRGANNLLTLAMAPGTYFGGSLVWASREHGTLAAPVLELTTASLQLSRPGFFTVSAGGSGTVELAWFDGASGESGFRIERRVANGQWILLASTPPNTTNFTDASALPGVIYEYRVRATGSSSNDSTWATMGGSTLQHTDAADIVAPAWSEDGSVINIANAPAGSACVPTGFTYYPAPTAFVTGQTLSATTRNNYTGQLGMKFTVGANPLVIAELGRWVVSGNSGSHTLKLVDAATNLDVPGGSVVVNTAGAPVGFKYGTLSSPVTLAAGASYYLVSSETSGGDLWYDNGSILTTTGTAVATITGHAYGYGTNSYIGFNSPNASYGPLDFRYLTSAIPFGSSHDMTTLRNDFTGWLGMKIAVGSSSFTVGQLGRWVAPGNTGTHTVKLVNANTGALLGSVSVATLGAVPGSFKYAALPSAVTLEANTNYYVLSQETSGGDLWYDYSFAATGTATGYQSWLLANGLPMDASGEGSATATPASDGVPNLIKYALGLAPTASGNSGRLNYGQTTESGGNYLTFVFTRPEPEPTDITYEVQSSSDLINWSSEGLAEVAATTDAGLRTITVRDALPLNENTKRFMRLKITQP